VVRQRARAAGRRAAAIRANEAVEVGGARPKPADCDLDSVVAPRAGVTFSGDRPHEVRALAKLDIPLTEPPSAGT
jgi:hypothetical protein